MKQNSRIMFNHAHKTLTYSYLRNIAFASFAAFLAVSGPLYLCAAANSKPEYLTSFDPAKGFKPAQGDLTEILLQIAGSLEYYGSPEPYHAPHEGRTRTDRGETPASVEQSLESVLACIYDRRIF